MVERSDIDDRLQNASDAQFQNSSIENTENTARKQAMMALLIRKQGVGNAKFK